MEDSIEAVSSEEGDAGGVSGGEQIEVGVVGREEDIDFVKLKMGEEEVGGVGGLRGCIGEGGIGAIDSTVAMTYAERSSRYKTTCQGRL